MGVETATVARRIAVELDRLARPPFTGPGPGVTRYAFTEPYRRTVEHVRGLLEGAGLAVRIDAVGNLIGSTAEDRQGFGVGSHLDSVRQGGAWDGVVGVLVAWIVAEVARDHNLRVPLHVVSWVEEEGSGFGEMLLGSRIATGDVTIEALETTVRSLDDDRTFAQHCAEAGGAPDRAGETRELLERFANWVEVHIEQGRVLEDIGARLGVVTAIAGYVQGEVILRGRADHAGTTPMALRADASVVAAKVILAAEHAARQRGHGVVATVGQLTLIPGAINVIPGEARMTLDIRAAHGEDIDHILMTLSAAVEVAAREHGVRSEVQIRKRQDPVILDDGVVAGLLDAAKEVGVEPLLMVSGAAHDTMRLAPHVPAGMLFLPCREGVSHAPDEEGDARDAALAVQVLLRWLSHSPGRGRRVFSSRS